MVGVAGAHQQQAVGFLLRVGGWAPPVEQIEDPLAIDLEASSSITPCLASCRISGWVKPVAAARRRPSGCSGWRP